MSSRASACVPQSCPRVTSDCTIPGDGHRGLGQLDRLRSASQLRKEDQPLPAGVQSSQECGWGGSQGLWKRWGAPGPLSLGHLQWPSNGSEAWPWTSFPAPPVVLIHFLGWREVLIVLKSPSQKILPGNQVLEHFTQIVNCKKRNWQSSLSMVQFKEKGESDFYL